MPLSTLARLSLFCIALSGTLSTPTPPKKAAGSVSHPSDQLHLQSSPSSTSNSHEPWYAALSQDDLDWLHRVVAQSPPRPADASPNQLQHSSTPNSDVEHSLQDQDWVDTILLDGSPPHERTSPPDPHPFLKATFTPQQHSHDQAPSTSQARLPPHTTASAGFTPAKALKSSAPNWQSQLSKEKVDTVMKRVQSHWRHNSYRKPYLNAETYLREIMDLASARKILANDKATILRMAAMTAPRTRDHLVYDFGDKIPTSQMELDERYLAEVKKHAIKSWNPKEGSKRREGVPEKWPHKDFDKDQLVRVMQQLQDHWDLENGHIRGRLKMHFRPELGPDLLLDKETPEFKEAARYLQAQTERGYAAFEAQVDLARRIKARQEKGHVQGQSTRN